MNMINDINLIIDNRRWKPQQLFWRPDVGSYSHSDRLVVNLSKPHVKGKQDNDHNTHDIEDPSGCARRTVYWQPAQYEEEEEAIIYWLLLLKTIENG